MDTDAPGREPVTNEASGRSTREAELREFIGRCHEALTHQSQGRPEPFLELWSHADDVSVMAAVGGYEVGFEKVSALLSWASTVQSFESWSAESIATAVGPDLALSVELEHYGQHVEGENKEMTLRATQVYRREEGEWRIIHRHGDVLTPVEVKW
jgi:ketosteroid isomerase-like protein